MPAAVENKPATGSAAGNADGSAAGADAAKAAAAAAQGAAASDQAAAAAAATKATADAAAAKAAADAGKPATSLLGADGKPAEVVYDLKAPEGVEVAKATIDEVTAFAKEHKLAPEVAQKLLERETSARSTIAEEAQATLRKTADEVWPAECKADKEIGGQAFVENMGHAKKAIDQFGSDAFKKALNESGLGNHPEMVRFCVKVGKTLADDKIIPAGKATAGQVRLADALFGDPPQKQE